MATNNSKESIELQAQVEERTLELKQYVQAYGPRLLLVGGIALGSCLLLGILISRAVDKYGRE